MWQGEQPLLVSTGDSIWSTLADHREVDRVQRRSWIRFLGGEQVSCTQ